MQDFLKLKDSQILLKFKFLHISANFKMLFMLSMLPSKKFKDFFNVTVQITHCCI
jgi:hypothetical protein